MMHASVRTYMTLDEFASTVRNNSTKFLNFGDTITQGIQTYSALAHHLMNAEGPARNTLIEMGYDVQRVNQLFINYLDKVYRGTRLETVDRRRVADSFIRYQTTVHKLTAITGKTSERIEKELEAITNNQSTRIEMNSLNTDQRDQMTALMTHYAAFYGQAGTEMFAAAYNGFTPQSQRATHLHYLNPTIYHEMRRLIRTIRQTDTGINNFEGIMEQYRIREVRRMINTYKSNEHLFRAQAAGDSRLTAFLQAFEGPLGFITRFGNNVDNITDEQISDLLAEVDRETNSRDALTRTVRAFENMVRDFRVGFFDVIFGPNGPLSLLVGPNSTMPDFSAQLQKAGRETGIFVTDVIPKILRFLGRFLTPEGRQLLQTELESMMKNLGIRISYLLMRTFSDDHKWSVEAMNEVLRQHGLEYEAVLADQYARYERSIQELTTRFGIHMGQGQPRPPSDPGAIPPVPPSGGGTLPPRPGAPSIDPQVQPPSPGTVPRPAMVDLTGDMGRLGVGGRQRTVRRTIFHHTGGGNVSGAIETLRQRQLSYNYIIDYNGVIHQLVSEGRMAWHAGGDNSDSIGVALVGRNASEAPTPAQLQSAGILQRYLSSRYNYPLTSVQGHGDTDPSNKPGEGFAVRDYIRSMPSGSNSLGTLNSLGRAFGNAGRNGDSVVSSNGKPLGQSSFTDLLKDTADVEIRNDIEIANSNLSKLVDLLEKRISIGYKMLDSQAKRSGNLFELT